jgi:TolB protein
MTAVKKATRCLLGATLFATALLTWTSSASASFPGQNGRIAFVSDRTGSAEIYTMNADGFDVRQVTQAPGADHAPAVSPDGRRIAFISERSGSSDLYIMNTDGTGVKRLASIPGTEATPAFSPDGQRIAFASDRDGTSEIYTISAVDGTGVLQVSNGPGDAFTPSYSPDGTKILHTANRGFGRTVTTVKTNGTDGTGLFSFGTGAYAPAYSPDGKKVIFHSDVAGNVDVYERDAAGVITRLTDDARPEGNASYSPDGKKITFDALRGSDRDVYVADADGTNAVDRTGDTSDEYGSAWMTPSIYDNPAQASLSLGKAKANKRRGTALLPATVSRAGNLSFRGRGLRAGQSPATSGGTVQVKLVPVGKAKAKLSRTGKLLLPVTVAYVADTGETITKAVQVKLLHVKRH